MSEEPWVLLDKWDYKAIEVCRASEDRKGTQDKVYGASEDRKENQDPKATPVYGVSEVHKGSQDPEVPKASRAFLGRGGHKVNAGKEVTEDHKVNRALSVPGARQDPCLRWTSSRSHLCRSRRWHP